MSPFVVIETLINAQLYNMFYEKNQRSVHDCAIAVIIFNYGRFMLQKVRQCQVKNMGGIAVVYLDHPPVNALSRSIRDDIFTLLTAFKDDHAVKAVVFTTTPDLPFSAGADIKEFSGPMQGKFFLDFYHAIKDLNKPVISGIRKYALGGGLEFAMIGHYRVAHQDARLGLPEVKLGLIPGGTGTISLPRLVGIEKSLDMIVTSKPVSAADALTLGLVDVVAEDDLEATCIALANKVIKEAKPLVMPLHRDRPSIPSPDYFEQKRALFLDRYHGFKAPERLLNCLEACATLPLDQALSFETEQFIALITGNDSAGMRYAFFSERLAAHIPDVRKEDARTVQHVGIVGGGLMGSGIAMAFINRGFTVTCLEVSQDRADACIKLMQKQYEKSVSQNKMKDTEAQDRLSRFKVTVQIEDLSVCDLVIEAVFEKLDLKLEIMQKLDAICGEKTILASNTSGLDLNQIAAVTGRPDRVLGLHFFSPANVMRLLEVVRGKSTSSATLATGLQVAKQLKKVPVVVGVCPGFVGNRMIFKYFEQLEWLLLRGCSPKQIDHAIKTFGFPMGPCEMADMAGLDIWVYSTPGQQTLVHDFVASGRLGQKSRSGFYDYKEGSNRPHPSEKAQILIDQSAEKQNIRPMKIDDAAIVQRLLCALICEGLHILDEGIAQRASDIDVIYVHGYGFPIYRGGPMFYADQVGLDTIRSQLQDYKSEAPKQWLISPLLDTLIAEKKKLSGYKRA